MTETISPYSTRAIWIDRLRVVLTGLVIFHHAAITYGASGAWFFKAQPETDLVLTFIAAVDQSFFMGFFFFISGLFVPQALDRKGAANFIRERIIRLGIPVLAFGFVLGPLTLALASADGSDLAATIARHLTSGQFVLGPLWFPAALLIFCCVTAALWHGTSENLPVPAFWRWLVLAVLTGMAALLVRQLVPVGREVLGFQLGYFPSYIVLFWLGLKAGQSHWLEKVPSSSYQRGLVIGLLALPILPAALLSVDNPTFETGLSIPAIIYAVWEPFVALGAISALLLWSQWRGSKGSAFWSWAASNSYGAFILHAPILVSASRILQNLSLPDGAALVLSSVVTMFLALVLTTLLRTLPIVRRVI